MRKIHISITIDSDTWKEFDTTAQKVKRSKSDLISLIIERLNKMDTEKVVEFLYQLK